MENRTDTNQKSSFEFNEGVFVSTVASGAFHEFESAYTKLRDKESRMLNVESIRKLPEIETTHPDYNLWQIRRKNIQRFIRYLSGKNGLSILDIGCGNGFFTKMMARSNHSVAGVDINLTELKLAASAFGSINPKWYYADVMKENIPGQPFHMITFCGSFHYFEDPLTLINRCKQNLLPGGEIHIIDSPFYTLRNRVAAQNKTSDYYRKMGSSPLISHFHHHTLDFLKPYNHKIMYKPSFLKRRLMGIKDSPFLWICISKQI